MASAPQSKISGASADSALSALDLFSVPDTHTSVMKGHSTEHYPIDGGSKNGLIEFRVENSSELYLDLKHTYLELAVKIIKQNGQAMGNAGATDLWPGDNFMHSIFSKVTASINNKDVEYHANYAYDAYLERLFEHSKEVKETALWPQSGWVQDNSVGADGGDAEAADVTARKLHAATSPLLSFYGPLKLAIFKGDRFLLPGTTFGLKLDRSSAAFCINSAGNVADQPKVEVHKAVLHVRKCEVNDSVRMAHMQLLSEGNTVKYPLQRKKTRFYVLNQGVTEGNIVIEQNGQIPTSVFVALTPLLSKTGRLNGNPYCFKNFGATEIELSIDGLAQGPRYKVDFTTGDVARAYGGFIQAIGKMSGTSSCGITLAEWKSNKTIYGFDLSPDLCHEGFHFVKHGNITLKLKFAQATQENIAVCVSEDRDDLVEVDLQRDIKMVSNIL